MKFIILCSITCFSVCSIGCSNEDTATYEADSLNGNWYLSRYGGGISGQFTFYENKDVIWNFDTINNTVFIRSQLDYFGPKSGTYSYGIRQNNQNNEVLFLNDSVQGIMLVHEDELKLAQGLIATFRR